MTFYKWRFSSKTTLIFLFSLLFPVCLALNHQLNAADQNILELYHQAFAPMVYTVGMIPCYLIVILFICRFYHQPVAVVKLHTRTKTTRKSVSLIALYSFLYAAFFSILTFLTSYLLSEKPNVLRLIIFKLITLHTLFLLFAGLVFAILFALTGIYILPFILLMAIPYLDQSLLVYFNMQLIMDKVRSVQIFMPSMAEFWPKVLFWVGINLILFTCLEFVLLNQDY